MSETAVRPPGYFERLREIFDRVADLDGDVREVEIARATAGDATLEEELRALLDHAARSETTLDSPLVVTDWNEPPPLIPGFRVLRRIGSGGSATVYLAEQQRLDFTRPVALKVVERVLAASSASRISEEQRILARLEHPGIARLYDTGVTVLGQPYLAMEHVEGDTIVEHCRVRELPPRARIELCLAVLDAVRYAHEQGIVHRDLKPANIFVSARGEAKLLDFGIAKLFDADATVTIQRAMTPAYASPEQLRGGRITPASDLYSLGIVLYELLTDTLPEQDPKPPSALVKSHDRFWRDLDAVVLKALRHQPHDRYASAAAFANDLRRVLAGRRVAARGRRTWIGVAIAIVAVIAIAAMFLIPKARHPSELAALYDAGFGDGAQKLERFQFAAARDSFRRATRAPNALAWDGLARAENGLGEIGHAADAAKRAAALPATNLPRDEVERMRAMALAAGHNWPAAITALDALFAREPERIDVGIALVRTQLAAGRSDAADITLGRLRQLPAGNGDPRIDLLEAEVAQQLSEFQRAAAAATRARTRARQLGAPVLALRAERIHAESIGRLDRREEARTALASIARRDDALGLTREAAASRLALGTVLIRIGGDEETRATLEQALAGLRAARDERGDIVARTVLSIAAGKRGELESGIKTVDGALADARRIHDRWAEAYVLSQKLTLLNWSDDEAGSRALIEPTLAALRDSGNRQLLMATLTNLAIMATQQSDLDTAETYLIEADVLGRRVGSQLSRASIDSSRAYLDQTRGNFDLARERYTSALEKATAAGVPLARAEYLSDLAWLEVSDEQPVAAAARATEAIEVFKAAGDSNHAMNLEAVLAWSDAARNDVVSAQRHLDVLRKAAAQQNSGSARFNLLLAEARVAEALKDWARVAELRREAVRLTIEWKDDGLRIQQQLFLAEALAHAGQRREFDQLVDKLLPEVERLGMRRAVRDLEALRAALRAQ